MLAAAKAVLWIFCWKKAIQISQCSIFLPLALENARKRLGDKAANVRWLACDLTNFRPARQYYMARSRHLSFLHHPGTDRSIYEYCHLCRAAGWLHVIGTFSDKGPTECTSLPVKQYTEEALSSTLAPYFQKISCTTENHTTPFQTVQNFLFLQLSEDSRVENKVTTQ